MLRIELLIYLKKELSLLSRLCTRERARSTSYMRSDESRRGVIGQVLVQSNACTLWWQGAGYGINRGFKEKLEL
jgi:hypothetical protein